MILLQIQTPEEMNVVYEALTLLKDKYKNQYKQSKKNYGKVARQRHKEITATADNIIKQL